MKKFNFLKMFVLASMMMPAIMVCAQSKLDKQVMMTIGDQDITVKEFCDVYYKNNLKSDVIEKKVPPLRERKDDIPLLVQSFVESLSQDMGKAAPTFEQEAIEALQQYQWTGNIRELHNIVERLVILCGSTITKDDVVLFGNPLN